MLAILGLVFPLIKSFLGENVIEKMLAHKQALAATAHERERVAIDADVNNRAAPIRESSQMKRKVRPATCKIC